MAVTYRAPQSLQVAGEGLELVPVLVGLLLGHPQGLGVPGSRVRQICKLGQGTTCAMGWEHRAGMCSGGTRCGNTALLCSTAGTWPQGETSLAQMVTAEIPNPTHKREPPNPRDQPQPRDGDTRGGDSQAIHLWGNHLPLHLGFVPLLGLLDVAGGHGLVLAADVTQGGRQVRLARVHLDVHPLLSQLLLQLPQLLWGQGGQGSPLSPGTPSPRAGLPPRGPCGGRRSRPAGSPRAAPGPGEPRQHCPRPVTVGGQEGLSQLATRVFSPLSCWVMSIPSCSHPALPLSAHCSISQSLTACSCHSCPSMLHVCPSLPVPFIPAPFLFPTCSL